MSHRPSRQLPDERQHPRAERLAHWLDSAFRVPGTDFRVGFDAVIGFLPGVGDVASAVLSSVVVVEGYRAGVPPATLVRMMLNVLIDIVIGAIPVVGDLFDVFWKANERNVALIHAWETDPSSRRGDWRWIAGVLLSVLTVFVAVVTAVIWLLSRLVGLVV